MINTKAVAIVHGFCVVFCKRGSWLWVFKCGITLSGVSFRITFLHEQKSDGALPPLGREEREGGKLW